jgi:uncharacterized membrane protein YgcG
MKKTIVLLLLLCCSFSYLMAQDYVFERYHLEMDARLDNSFKVQETIVANFSTPRHGIFREIPVQFGRVRVKLENLQSNEPIKEDSVSSGYATFRLGSENRTVTGIKEYRISYTYTIGDDRNEEYDEFYYNLLGPGWQAEIQEFTFRINFPEPIDPSMIFLSGGQYGSTAQRGSFKLSSDRKTITGEASNLLPGEALTLRVQLPQGYFSEVKPFVDYTIPFSIVALLVALFASFHATKLFRRYGREELFVPVVQFEPPAGLSPLLVGYLADGVVDNKDLTSMLFYWADQGLLTIEEKSKKDFLFTKLKEIKTDKVHERKLFDALFACGDGSRVTLKQLETGKFAIAMTKAKSDVHAYFKGPKDLKDPVAEKKRVIAMLWGALVVVLNALAITIVYPDETTIFFLVIGFMSMALSALVAFRLNATVVLSSFLKRSVKIVALVLFCLFMLFLSTTISFAVVGHSLAYSLGMSLSLVLFPAYLGFLTIVIGKRSPYAQKKLEEIAGYHEFISKVEIEKLKMMIDADPAFFYHVLGYAIVLNLEDVWAKKFSRINVEQPSWYIGRNPVRDALFYSALSHRLHSSVMERSIYSQAKSGSRSPVHSSFGSRGFSGGGFGGGGGGAW